MQIRPLNPLVKKQLARFGARKKFEKQKVLFEANPSYPSLNTEKLEPKTIGLYSFRLDKKLRAIFRIRNGFAEILYITKHYHK